LDTKKPASAGDSDLAGGLPREPAPGRPFKPVTEAINRQGEIWLLIQMPAHPDMIEMLMRSPLLAHMDEDVRQDLALRFETRPFTAGQTLIASGADGRALLEILAGTADVFVRDGDHRYKVAQLEPGAIAGESSFFEGTPRTADIIGSSEGIVAVMPWSAYITLAREQKPAADALERAVLGHLTKRLTETNARLSALIDARQTDGFKSTFQRWFGFLGANHG